MGIRNYITILLVVFLYACSEIKERKVSDCTTFEKKIGEYTAKFGYEASAKQYKLLFNESIDISRQKYVFDKYGTLLEKRGVNFFNEEEVYFFDVNNTISESRKLVLKGKD